MKGYFVVVKAHVWNGDLNEFYDVIQLYKVTDCKDLGEQLDKEFGKELYDFSVTWIGGECLGLDITDNIFKELKEWC